jgi:hypothetical protein
LSLWCEDLPPPKNTLNPTLVIQQSQTCSLFRDFVDGFKIPCSRSLLEKTNKRVNEKENHLEERKSGTENIKNRCPKGSQ